MARWDPGAEQRLRRAALELYAERGFEHVSAAEITDRAGLTRRTFFRYFADKREVLFAGSEHLPGIVAEAVSEVDGSLEPLAAAFRALAVVGTRIVEQVEPHDSHLRRAVIDASPELQERERTKLAHCTAALAAALEARGTDGDTAGLAARVAMAVLEAAFARWTGNGGRVGFGRCFDEATARFSTMCAERS